MESDGDVWNATQVCDLLGARNSRSKFNVPLQIESRGFSVVPKRPCGVSGALMLRWL